MRRPYHAPKIVSSHAVATVLGFGHFIEHRCNRCLADFYATPLTDTVVTCPRCDSTNAGAI